MSELDPGLLYRSAVEHHVQALLMQRAVKKLKTPLQTLKTLAILELQQAGHWHDDVRVDVQLNVTLHASRCQRLLHGIPSPRYWQKCGTFWMAAIDVLYFFAENGTERQALLQRTMPDMNTLVELEAWLAGFSSRRFHRNLVDALLAHAECKLNDPVYSQHLSPSFALQQVASDASEIDRYAWARGYSAITLAKAAPVWTPPTLRSNVKLKNAVA